jgi:hypothetical protein
MSCIISSIHRTQSIFENSFLVTYLYIWALSLSMPCILFASQVCVDSVCNSYLPLPDLGWGDAPQRVRKRRQIGIHAHQLRYERVVCFDCLSVLFFLIIFFSQLSINQLTFHKPTFRKTVRIRKLTADFFFFSLRCVTQRWDLRAWKH